MARDEKRSHSSGGNAAVHTSSSPASLFSRSLRAAASPSKDAGVIIQPAALESKPASALHGRDAYSDSLPSQAPGLVFCSCQREITIREKPSSRTDRGLDKRETRKETKKLEFDECSSAPPFGSTRCTKGGVVRGRTETIWLSSEAALLEGHAGAESAAPGGDDGLHCQ